MRIGFYAPLKATDQGNASGDRAMARQFKQLLANLGHEVTEPCRLRTYDRGDHRRQNRLAALGARAADQLQRRLRQNPPDLWFTYHCYHKAPDVLGPRLAADFDIPYVIAEPSHAGHRASGAWAPGYRTARDSIRTADLCLAMSAVDEAGLRDIVKEPEAVCRFRPMIDATSFRNASGQSEVHKQAWRDRFGETDESPTLITVAMMRDGAKARSYGVLFDALAHLRDKTWKLWVVGDGEAALAVRAQAEPVASRIRWLGRIDDRNQLASLYAAADLFVWPAVDEAYGLVFLEAAAAGLPTVGGATHGVPEVSDDGVTGLLAPVGDPAAFADAVAELLADPARRRMMGRAARHKVARVHDLPAASLALADALDLARKRHEMRATADGG
ncbi:MAG: glycosyltransferase family 4 protein [Geminicoccaceae bacterium]